MTIVTAGQIWRNRKNTHLYTVLGTCSDANNLNAREEDQVIYRAYLTNETYHRSLIEFHEKFEYIPEAKISAVR